MSKHRLFVTLLAVAILTMLHAAEGESSVKNYEFVRGPSNEYHFGFDTSDGTSRQEEGKDDDQDQSLAIGGSVSWVAQDGSRYLMTYKADRRGYRPIIKRISGP